MTTNLTSRELFDEARDIGPHVEAMTRTYEEASLAYQKAKDAYELAEANAFLEAVEAGAKIETAKRIARIKSSNEKKEMDRLAAVKAAARLGSDKWQTLLETYTAISHVLNREIKTFSTYGANA